MSRSTGPKHPPFRALPLLVLAAALVLAGYFVNSNLLHHYLGATTSYDSSVQVGEFKISLSAPRVFEAIDKIKTTLRDVKISFPLDYEHGGCELTYGAAIYQYGRGGRLSPGPGQILYRNPRFLLKFKYDLKNKRCESKDLFLLSGDLPSKILVQFMRIEIDAQELREIPDAHGLEISVDPSGNLSSALSAAFVEIESGEPFLPPLTTKRNTSFSVPQIKDFELLVHPYRSLNDFVADELERRIERCRSVKKCDPILIAVAKITDRRILVLLETARLVGLPVHAISNYRFRLDQEADDWEEQRIEVENSPWFWMRGSPYSITGWGRLPMHTKFVVFGDDFVVSSNPNLRSGLRNRSREYSIVYRDRAVVDIFKEIFALVRSSFYYPLKVDLRDQFVMLLNANRPRQYAVSEEKPYVAIDTNEGVRSNAYGVLFETISRTIGKISVVMSPITNSCAAYRGQNCLYDLLQARAESGQLEMVLNGFYYVAEAETTALNDKAQKHWSLPTYRAALEHSPTHQIFSGWFGAHAPELKTYIEFSRPMSTHHERAALLGDEIAILGSANWANVATINTIELIHSPLLNKELRREFSSFDDPWFVSLRSRECSNPSCVGRCEFSLELNAGVVPDLPAYGGGSQSILEEFRKQYPLQDHANLQLVIPSASFLEYANGRAKGVDSNGDGQGSFSFVALDQAQRLPAMYECLRDRESGATFVVRLAAD